VARFSASSSGAARLGAGAALGLLGACSRVETREWVAADHESPEVTEGTVQDRPAPSAIAPPHPVTLPATGGPSSPVAAAASVATTSVADAESLSSPPHGGAAFATWVKSCVPCHGRIGRGDGPTAAALPMPDFSSADFQRRRTDEALALAVVKGTARGMPAFSLPPEVVRELVNLTRQMGGGEASEDPPGR